VLMEHRASPKPASSASPTKVVGEVVKAFVSLKAGFEPSEALRMELLGHARKRLGAAVAPKEIDFRDALPRTRSGKIMRRLLKARETRDFPKAICRPRGGGFVRFVIARAAA